MGSLACFSPWGCKESDTTWPSLGMRKQTINLMKFFRVVWEYTEAGGRETIIKPLNKSGK